jgi:diguanylate cyclase (GGDEF)-like protein
VSHQTHRRRHRFASYYEDAVRKLRRRGFAPRQIKALRAYGLLATDNVTGFHEGRSGKGRISTLRRAIRHVKRTGEQAFYVEMDLRNLSGLNAALGHSRGNRVFARVAAIIRQELSGVASEADFFRHGGDEMSAFLIDTTEEAVQAAAEAVRSRVGRLAKRHGLDTIPHPKYQGDLRRRGIGVHFGACRLSAEYEQDPTLVFSAADTELERDKSSDFT